MAQDPKTTTQQPKSTIQPASVPTSPSQVSLPPPRVNQTETEMAWDDLRTSRAFPAIVGGVAGAAIGVGLMLVANQLRKPKTSSPAAYDANGNPMNVVYLPTPNQFRILGFTVGDLIALATIGMTMARQIQEMRRVEGVEDALEAHGIPVPTAPPPPLPDPVQSTVKKK